MLYIDVPTREEFLALSDMRFDACISIYLPTSPLKQDREASRVQLASAIKETIRHLEEAKFDKRRLNLLEDQLVSILEDEDFWHFHACSLAILATPDSLRTYRLANDVSYHVDIADRFYLKPLLRAITFPHSAYILALSENEVRLIEFFADVPPEEVKVADMPKDAASAVGKEPLDSHFNSRRIHGAEGKKIRLTQYTRKIDSVLRPTLNGSGSPLLLACTEPLGSIYRSTNSLSNLLAEGVLSSPDLMSMSELVAHARPLLDSHYQTKLDEIEVLFDRRGSQRRTVFELDDVARAATFGVIDTLLFDVDATVPGSIDDQGKITFAEQDNSKTYGVIGEIVKRALESNARVLAVSKSDIPHGGQLAAILRHPL